MSSEVSQISTPDAVLRIKRLIDTNQGDPGRLQYISETLQKGKKLFHSDQIYLEKKISARVIPIQIKRPTETDEKIKIVKKILVLNLGDSGRLQHILKTLEGKRTLYHSDNLYLDSKTQQLQEFMEGKRLKQRFRSTIPARPTSEFIKKPIVYPTPEVSFEKIEQAINPEQSEKLVEETPTAEPKQASEFYDLIEDTDKIDSEIQQEHEQIIKLQHIQQKNKLKRDELSHLIAYRQEYEQKLNLQKELLQKEINIEQEKIKEKDKLVQELIKNQAKLIQSKAEREVLLEQIKIDKEKSDKELQQAQKELEAVKQQYEAFQDITGLKKQILDDQIKEQSEKIDKLKKDSD
ncbi:MAG TPA: hypothetical protein VMW74_03640 [Nitrosopumilaceae archaeon]|nr:hypothetical protein [Nitrosopumilaceae archaeon]